MTEPVDPAPAHTSVLARLVRPLRRLFPWWQPVREPKLEPENLRDATHHVQARLLEEAFGPLGGLPATYQVAVIPSAAKPGLVIDLVRAPGRNGVATAPDHPRTHWAPMRLLFAEPLDVRIGHKLVGELVFRANPQSSYSVTFSSKLEGKPVPDRTFHLQGYFWWEGSD